jgi:hypothetical protein
MVDDNIIKLPHVADILGQLPQAAGDGLLAIGRTGAQARLKFARRRRQDVNRGGLRVGRAYMACALPIDFEDEILLLSGKGNFDRCLGSRIVMAIHLGPFQEFPPLAASMEFFLGQEVVIAAIVFGWAWGAGGAGDRQGDAVVPL